MKKELPYKKTLPLLSSIENVECWNLTSGARFTLPAGTLLKIEHAYDATHTTCMVVDEAGKAIPLFPSAYRWIIGNKELAAATGHYFPMRTADLIGDIIACESGTATPKQTKRLLRNPVCRKLQGHYSSRCTA